MMIKIKRGRKRLALIVLIMWLLAFPFFITSRFPFSLKLFVIASNVMGWSIFFLLFVEKEEYHGVEIGERALKFREYRRYLTILFILTMASVAAISFFDLRLFFLSVVLLLSYVFAGIDFGLYVLTIWRIKN